MSQDRFVTGLSIKYGSMSVVFRDASDITVNKHTMTFLTAVRCTGNNYLKIYNDDGTKVVRTERVFAMHDEQWVTDKDIHIPNPTLIRYESAGSNLTKVLVSMSHIEEFKTIAGY
jgi:hypothetical protein